MPPKGFSLESAPSPFIFLTLRLQRRPQLLHRSLIPVGPLRHSGVDVVWQLWQHVIPLGGSLEGLLRMLFPAVSFESVIEEDERFMTKDDSVVNVDSVGE